MACGIMVLGGLLEEEARQRQAIAAEMTHEKLGRKTNGDMLTEKIPQASGKSREIAGKMLSVNPHYITDAKSVLTKAPELKERIMNGDIKLLEAKRIELAGTCPNKNTDLTEKIPQGRVGESREIAGKLLGVN
ncbi:MAG: hypothetical protein JRM78_04175 [Nitrososphaerota archaeon]|nr:hypothetical protein [Nitrososphaerota archaeon]MDG7047625.1 hypothetical protein [Nitrososphaerota archaeon]